MIKGMIAPHDQIQSSLFWSTAQIKGNIFVMLTPLKSPQKPVTDQNKIKKNTIKTNVKIILPKNDKMYQMVNKCFLKNKI